MGGGERRRRHRVPLCCVLTDVGLAPAPPSLRPANVQLRCPLGILALLSGHDQNISRPSAFYFSRQAIMMSPKFDSSPQGIECLT